MAVCGDLSIARFDQKSGCTRVIAIKCKTWRCPRCGPRRRRAYSDAIARAAGEYRMVRILTLTLDPRKLPAGENPVRYIQACWAEFRLAVARNFGRRMRFIRVLEMREDGSHVHLHALVDRYLPQGWISRQWASLGGGKIVDIRMVAPRRVAGYVAKYLAKALSGAQIYRLRRVTCSRGIVLLAKRKPAAEKWLFARIAPKILANFYLAEKIEASDGRIEAMEFTKHALAVAQAFLKFQFFNPRSRLAFGLPA